MLTPEVKSRFKAQLEEIFQEIHCDPRQTPQCVLRLIQVIDQFIDECSERDDEEDQSP